MHTENNTTVRYRGEYLNDKRNGKCDELSITDNASNIKQALFWGRLDADEELTKEGDLDLTREAVYYKGDFHQSGFHGYGSLLHKDTKNEFKGAFMNHLKHGKCTFTLDQGYQYKG